MSRVSKCSIYGLAALGGVAVLVIVRAAGEHDDRRAGETAADELAGVAGHAAFRKAGQIGIGDANGIPDLVDQPSEPGAEHQRCLRSEAAEPLDEAIDRFLHFRMSPRKPYGSRSPTVVVSATPVSSQR